MRFVVDPRILLRVLLGAVLALGAAGLALRLVALDPVVAADLAAGRPAAFLGYPLLLPVLDVDAEGNLPAWLSASMLLLSALVLWGIAAGAHRTGDPWRRQWAVLAVVFAYLSVDELAQLHELGVPLAGLLVPQRGIFTFGWVLIAAPLVLAFGLTFLRFLRALPDGVRGAVALAGVLYVGGAFGLELVGGALADSAAGERSVPYVLVSSAEELLEMLGSLLFLRALTLLRRVPETSEAQAVGAR